MNKKERRQFKKLEKIAKDYSSYGDTLKDQVCWMIFTYCKATTRQG